MPLQTKTKEDPGKFHSIKDKKGYWTLDNVKVQIIGPKGYPEPTTGEACFSDSYKSFVSIKDLK
jgi:hypothetical protein